MHSRSQERLTLRAKPEPACPSERAARPSPMRRRAPPPRSHVARAPLADREQDGSRTTRPRRRRLGPRLERALAPRARLVVVQPARARPRQHLEPTSGAHRMGLGRDRVLRSGTAVARIRHVVPRPAGSGRAVGGRPGLPLASRLRGTNANGPSQLLPVRREAPADPSLCRARSRSPQRRATPSTLTRRPSALRRRPELCVLFLEVRLAHELELTPAWQQFNILHHLGNLSPWRTVNHGLRTTAQVPAGCTVEEVRSPPSSRSFPRPDPLLSSAM